MANLYSNVFQLRRTLFSKGLVVSSVIVVISPLRALMEDQVRQLNDIGIPAIAIADEEDELMQQVLNGPKFRARLWLS